MPPTLTISVGLADVRRDPDPDSELVTQALMNMPVTPNEITGDWTHVALPDYSGWIRTDELEEPITTGFTRIGDTCATPLRLVAVINTTHTPIYAEVADDQTLETVYLSTILPLIDTTSPEWLQVGLPGERVGWLARQDVLLRQREAVYLKTPIATITRYARMFLDIPYLWGGTSWRGIDCSGFVQLCYRMGGYMLPRDADQQHAALSQPIQRDALQEGDLIFFGRERITHVGMALNAHEFIHAEGVRYNRVIINSFDPTDTHFDQRFSDMVWDIRRVGTP